MNKNSKKIVLACALLIISASILGLLYWLYPKDQSQSATSTDQSDSMLSTSEHPESANSENSPNSAFNSTSQMDTEIGCKLQLDASQHLVVNEQTKNCFEYFITQYGEKSLPQIKSDFEKYIKLNYKAPALPQILDLWKRYMDYRAKLGALQPSTEQVNNVKYYRGIYEAQQNLRKNFFSTYEIEGLFGAEDTYDTYTLSRMDVLENKSLSAAEKAKRLKSLFDQLPTDLQENLEQITKLEDLRTLTADLKSQNASAQELHQMRVNLVGTEATGRLETLDTQRNQWQKQVSSYLSERDSILKSGMSDSAKSTAITNLRQQQFSSEQDRLRLNAFETIHDQGGKPSSN